MTLFLAGKDVFWQFLTEMSSLHPFKDVFRLNCQREYFENKTFFSCDVQVLMHDVTLTQKDVFFYHFDKKSSLQPVGEKVVPLDVLITMKINSVM